MKISSASAPARSLTLTSHNHVTADGKCACGKPDGGFVKLTIPEGVGGTIFHTNNQLSFDDLNRELKAYAEYVEYLESFIKEAQSFSDPHFEAVKEADEMWKAGKSGDEISAYIVRTMKPGYETASDFLPKGEELLIKAPPKFDLDYGRFAPADVEMPKVNLTVRVENQTCSSVTMAMHLDAAVMNSTGSNVISIDGQGGTVGAHSVGEFSAEVQVRAHFGYGSQNVVLTLMPESPADASASMSVPFVVTGPYEVEEIQRLWNAYEPARNAFEAVRLRTEELRRELLDDQFKSNPHYFTAMALIADGGLTDEAKGCLRGTTHFTSGTVGLRNAAIDIMMRRNNETLQALETSARNGAVMVERLYPEQFPRCDPENDDNWGSRIDLRDTDPVFLDHPTDGSFQSRCP